LRRRADVAVTGAKIFADPLGFTERLRDCQAELKMASQSFEARLNKLSRDTEQETVQLQYWATYNQASIHETLQTIEKRITEERASRVEVLEKLNPLLNHIMDALYERESSGPSRKALKLLPDIDPEQILGEHPGIRIPLLRRLLIVIFHLGHFLYDRDLVRTDCAALAKRANRLGRTSHDASRLAALQTNPRLRAWLTIDEPSLLLLNGRADPRPDSEVSLFTAKVFQQLLAHHDTYSDQEAAGARIIPLGFFCGQHRDWLTDDNGNPEELAMSLLLQLIDRGRGVLDSAVLWQCYERLRPGDVASICSMFETLVLSLGSGVVVIVVVDGLRFFAQPRERCNGTKDVVTRLVTLHRDRPAATLKFLIASPTMSEFVEELFTEDEVLELPRDMSSAVVKSPARQKDALADGRQGL
jgi:hypothetical protein